ncbi:type III PLP-dependent enzyme [Guyparkeria hydrothermalis]|uniref:type III PLP-dependent enzyme n=1 Tax=Guyparkeria hydrothermalis TaxID=923 RepID=UPI002020EB92|nr:type III PLP-dependent enzyme [Guyparkeria hydrothermalis]MCL7750276.1 type III PLP-dependent enzyme [Guyparkeria hydrothermalis]
MEFRLARMAQEATRLQAANDTPLCAYLYDLPALRQYVNDVITALPERCEMFYAVKANAETPILDTLDGRVAGFEAASGGELALIRERFPTAPLVFGGPGKLVSELSLALDLGVELIHVESLTELERLARLLEHGERRQAVLLRMNLRTDNLPSTSLTMGGTATPFGIDPDDLEACLAFLAQHPKIELRGFHFHLVSHQLDADAHLRLLDDLFHQVEQWRKRYRLDIEEINVGGGIGINYRTPERQFDWTGFCHGLERRLAEPPMQRYRIRFECGRYLTAPCGYYVMEVMDLKRNHGEWFAVCRGGTHHFRTPAAQGHSHPFVQLSGGDGEKGLTDTTVTIVGQLCTPKDVLARRVEITHLAIGDMLMFTFAGAYAWNISHQNFLRHPAPVMHFIDDGEDT